MNEKEIDNHLETRLEHAFEHAIDAQQAYDVLMRHINHERDALRVAVAVNLADVNEALAVPQLLYLLENDTCNEVRMEALESLIRFTSVTTFNALCTEYALQNQKLKENLKHPEKKSVSKRRFHQIIARGLRKYPCQHSTDILVNYLTHSTDHVVWIFAVDSLKALNHMGMQMIWQQLQQHPHHYVCEIATNMLAETNWQTSLNMNTLETGVLTPYLQNNAVCTDSLLKSFTLPIEPKENSLKTKSFTDLFYDVLCKYQALTGSSINPKNNLLINSFAYAIFSKLLNNRKQP